MNRKHAMKRVFFLIFIFFFLAAFAFTQTKYTVIPDYPRPGEPVTIAVNITDSSVNTALLIIDEKQAAKSSFFTIPAQDGKPSFLAAVLTVPSTARSGGVIIRLNNETGTVLEIPVIISPKDFDSEVIHLDPVNTGIRIDPNPQRTEEANRLWAILATTGNTVYHTGKFIPPVTSTRRTSFFGDRRVYQYSNGARDTSIHAGVDYGVPKGTPVTSCGTGRVVFAGMRIVSGNTVIIEHAPGIYSLYYHMDSINVKEGDIIETGTQVGLSGSTGLSTGPHLHWEIRVSTENTDPDAFVSRPIIDKDLIISRIFN